jgi:HAD superfamily hydrolase (TIGR01549 family)
MSHPNGMTRRPQAIIFDLYETLITEFDLHWVPSPSMAERLGVSEVAFSAAWTRVRDRRLTGELPDFAEALREICCTLGRELDEGLIQRLYRERLSTKAQPFFEIELSVLEMVQQLHEMSVRLSVLSNAASEEIAAWDSCVLAPAFDDAVFSCKVGLVKPDRRIYELACERLDVLPQSALFVGDGDSDELMGAAGAGLTPYWARWFLDRWPDWKRAWELRQRASRFRAATSPRDLTRMVTGMRAPNAVGEPPRRVGDGSSR